MEAKLLINDPNEKSDHLLVSLDNQSIEYLKQGLPLRLAFFTDDQEDLSWHERKSMVIVFGNKLDFEKHKFSPEKSYKQGMVDKSYLIEHIKQVKMKLAKMVMEELEVFDVPLKLKDTSCVAHEQDKDIDLIENIAPEKLLEFHESPKEIVCKSFDLPKEDKPKEYMSAIEVSKFLNISFSTLKKLAKAGKIKGENSGLGWNFIKSDMEDLRKDKPDFLKDIWTHSRSVKRNGPVENEIVFENEVYIHVFEATKLLRLSSTTLRKYLRQGLIKYHKEHRKDYYVSRPHMEALKAKPPDWLKKAWVYFAN